MDVIEVEILNLPKKKLKSIIGDAAKSALAINLEYVHDIEPGFKRIKKGKDFNYLEQEASLIYDEDNLKRIKSLSISLARENVLICVLPNGHLQATGIDLKKRKQYRYHPSLNYLKNHTKYYRFFQFGRVLPKIRLQLEKDLAWPGLPVEKVSAAMISLIECTNIRVGNSVYEKLYATYGLTTFKNKHVKIEGSDLQFSFKGKKGVHHEISLINKKLLKIVQSCRDIPGKGLFQYLFSDGSRKSIDFGMINDYIKKSCGEDFTAKDFRTWSGTLHAFLAFRDLGFFETVTEAKKNVVEVLDRVSKHLSNTRTVCKKYYVHPDILSLYESKSLEKYLHQLDKIKKDDN